MRRYTTSKQEVLAFGLPFEGKLDPNNKWILLADNLPWDDLVKPYLSTLCSNNGRPSVDARKVVAAIVIKHFKNLSDEETIEEIKENPYLQYFAGLSTFQPTKLFEPSLFVTLRNRLGNAKLDEMNDVIIRHFAMKNNPKPDESTDDEPPKNDLNEEPTDEPINKVDTTVDTSVDTTKNETAKAAQATKAESIAPIRHHGHCKIDTTAVPQNITFPTDLKLLNQCRLGTESLIDSLYNELKQPEKAVKPRTYRREARSKYLKISKIKKKTKAKIRQALREQLGYVRRNLLIINALLDKLQAENPTQKMPKSWSKTDIRKWWIVQEVYRQQREMYETKTNRLDHRIVSIFQPYVRPIVRGKEHKPTEFGAKIGLSTCKGYTRLDHIDWTNYGDAADLPLQVERYQNLYGYYPQKVNADKIYHTKANHAYLKEKGIIFVGKPLGRPTADSKTALARRTLRTEQAQRNHIEGKIGQMKTAYGLDLIRAKTSITSFAWISAIVLVTNLVTVLKDLRLLLKSQRYAFLTNIHIIIKYIRLSAQITPF